MVWIVLEQLDEGLIWDQIVREWPGKVSKDAIAEAIAIAPLVVKHEPFSGFHVGARRKSGRRPAALAAQVADSLPCRRGGRGYVRLAGRELDFGFTSSLATDFFYFGSTLFRRDWSHPNYCLVWLDVRRREAAESIRRFLRHPAFDTKAKRMGIVARVHAVGIAYWKPQKRSAQSLSWQ
jgi:hypothetical protein